MESTDSVNIGQELIGDDSSYERPPRRDEVLRQCMESVMPDDLELDQEEFTELISGYIHKFSDIYFRKTLTRSREEQDRLDLRLNTLRLMAENELSILDSLLPIQGTTVELVPWYVKPAEAALFKKGKTRAKLTWCRFVDAAGKRLGEVGTDA